VGTNLTLSITLMSSEDFTLSFFPIGSRNRVAGALSLGKYDSDLKGRIRIINLIII
jgi:hypothetical protein